MSGNMRSKEFYTILDLKFLLHELHPTFLLVIFTFKVLNLQKTLEKTNEMISSSANQKENEIQ